MLAILTTLMFLTAAAVSIWSIYATIAPRLPYVRELVFGSPVPPMPPLPRVRSRTAPRPSSRRTARIYRAAA